MYGPLIRFLNSRQEIIIIGQRTQETIYYIYSCTFSVEMCKEHFLTYLASGEVIAVLLDFLHALLYCFLTDRSIVSVYQHIIL